MAATSAFASAPTHAFTASLIVVPLLSGTAPELPVPVDPPVVLLTSLHEAANMAITSTVAAIAHLFLIVILPPSVLTNCHSPLR